ncbi:MAG: peptidoglycan-binding protein [Brachybacterium sp.]|uniref:peptidoglycan-binding protein n=1 Tax=Brachybacterium sp. TaxID=1891286 RepID=UPI0032421B5A
MATKHTTLPVSWSNKDEKERLREDASASLSRMLNRAVADTGVNFQLWDALRSKVDEERLFLRAYTRTSRGRTKDTARSYQGAIWALKAGHLPVASPDYIGGSVGTHRQGRAIDIHPKAIQDWIKANGRAYGWTWDTGHGVGEDHHFEYEAELDTMKAEGPLNHGWVQRIVGATVDHKIGTGTVAKIKTWQKAHGLTADGKVDLKTKAAMGGPVF